MNKQKSLEEIQYLINEGNNVLRTKYNYCGEITGSEIFVDDEIFSTWKEKVNLFLKSDSNFQNSLESFNKRFSMRTNLRYTEQYLSVLKALKNSIERDIITFNNIDKKENYNTSSIFIGHGHNLIWARIGLYLSDQLNIKPKYFEDSNRTSGIIPCEIENFVNDNYIKMAIFTLMKEDKTTNGKYRARQNVIDEAARFYTKLGREKIILIVESGVEYPSNLEGVLYIEFTGDEEALLLKIKDKLEKENMI